MHFRISPFCRFIRNRKCCINGSTICTITATGAGGTATASVTVAVQYPEPTVHISADPVTIMQKESATLTWSTTDADSVTIGPDIGAVDTSGSIAVSPMETTTYTAVVTGPGGTVTASATVTVTSPITLTITSPIDGATINRPDTMVQGTITNTTGNETGITINGVLALIQGTQFVANHVPLQEGENTITAVAVDTAGYLAQASITVYSQIIGDYITITANPESGIATLDTTLRIDATFTPSMIDIVKLPGGPDPLEYLPGSESNETIARLDQTGLYFFTAIAEDDQGNSYIDTVAVQVINEAALDALLRAKWEGMSSALTQNDVDGTVSYFSSFSKDAYSEIFTTISSILPQVAQDLGDIQFIRIMKNSVEYDIRTIRDSQEYSFYLIFEKDGDGLWKIRSF